MTKTELENKIVELEEQLNELKNIKIEEEIKVLKPKDGENFYYICGGDIVSDTWVDCTTNDFKYSIENCFKTEEEAKEKVKELKVKTAFVRYLREHEQESCDWKNREQRKYGLHYNNETGDFLDCLLLDIIPINYEFFTTSKSTLYGAVNEIGESEIKKYLFGVK